MGGKEKASKGMKKNPMEKYLEMYPPSSQKEEIGAGMIEKKETPLYPMIDLHGMTREETRIAVTDFLRNCRRRGIRRVLIVHGKGYHSHGPAVLSGLVRELLISLKEVVEDFGPAPPQKGGSGATWVLLRQRSR